MFLPVLLGPAFAFRGLQKRIVGGSIANPTRYPYFSSLTFAIGTDSDGAYIYCGGALIHDDIILSAAHCYDGPSLIDLPNSFVRVNNTDNAADFGFHEATMQKIVPHPRYNDASLDNDILIIKLDRAITQVKPVAFNIDSTVPAVGDTETVIGFGVTSNGGSGSSVLREVQVKAVSNQFCEDNLGGILDSIITCAYDLGKDSCAGDSGGPLIVTGSSSASDVVVGIVSFGGPCGFQDSPGAYTTWIQSQICSLSSKKPMYCSGSPIFPTPAQTGASSPTRPPTRAPVVITPAPTTKPKSPFCFSSKTTVQVKNKGTMPMKDLEIGDEVLAAAGKYEKVYSFGHRHESVKAEFLHILPSSLEISRDHMLLVRGRYVPASAIQVGDELESASGDVIIVEAINTVVRTGVYAPFTSSGTIVVSNIKVSNYIAFQDSGRLIVGGWETPFTYQWIAHMSQSPHRMLSRLGLSGAEEYTVDGMSTWIAGPHELSQWLVDQNGVIVTAMLVPAVGLGMLSMVTEWIVSRFV
jgi:trypsin